MSTCVHIVKNAELECTGICRIVAGLAKHSPPLGYRISVLFLGRGPLAADLKEMGIPSSIVPWDGSRTDIAGAWNVWSWLRKHPAEIVHSHHGGLAVRAVCRMAGVRAIVQHMHGRTLENKGGISVSELRFRAADAVIAASQAVADCLQGCHAEVIYAGVETAFQPPAQAPPTDALKLGILGRLIPLKNVEAVINVAACLADRGIDIEVAIAGSGPLEESLRALVARLGVGNRVRFLGWRTDIGALFGSWDVLVMPSLEEGFPLAALDAMAAACPVVASRIGGLSELIVDGVTGRLLPPGDTDSLVTCIAELACDRRRLAQMGLEGWKRAQLNFSNDMMARRTTALYDGLLSRGANFPI